MKHTYELTIRFNSDYPVKKHSDSLIQFENGLEYFVETKDLGDGIKYGDIGSNFIHGSGKTSLKKLTPTKRSTARKHKRK